MARFSYQGRDSQGKNVRGHIEAAHTDSAMAQLISQGIMADRIEPAKAGLPDLSQLFHRQVPLELMVIFCRQLYSLTKAGVPILRAIHGLAQSTDDKLLGQTLNQVGIDLTNGHSLSSAVAQHPRILAAYLSPCCMWVKTPVVLIIFAAISELLRTGVGNTQTH